MPNTDIVLPKDINLPMLAELFQDAYMDAEINESGELLIQEGRKTWVEIRGDGKRLYLLALFGFSESASLLDKLEYVNEVNDKIAIVRASMANQSKETLVFDYYVPIEGGVTKRAIVFAVKTFGDALDAALRMDAHGVIS